jgi:hypothetical protein
MSTHGNIEGRERGLCERGGRLEGGRGFRTIRSPTSASAGHREWSCCVCSVTVSRMLVQVSQMKVTDRVSVICPHNRERMTFVGQDGVGWQRVNHGGQNVLMNSLTNLLGPDPSFR